MSGEFRSVGEGKSDGETGLMLYTCKHPKCGRLYKGLYWSQFCSTHEPVIEKRKGSGNWGGDRRPK